MPTETPVKFEFRCSRCFHTQYASTDMATTQVECSHCQQLTEVPEPTSDRIARAEMAPPPKVDEPQTQPEPEREWTEADFEREAKRQYGVDASQITNMEGFASSRLKRFGGHVLDSMFLVVAYMVGFGAFLALLAVEYIPIDVFADGGTASMRQKAIALLAIYAIPTGLSIIQWNLIATEGKSIAKKILKMRIIRADGGSPGFIQGVVMRNWLRTLLNLLPFFGMADALFILRDSKRCLHDFIAGTHVIDEH